MNTEEEEQRTSEQLCALRRQAVRLHLKGLLVMHPEERLNADLKHAIGTRVPARTKAKLKAVATQHMTEIERSPERVKAFFQDPKVRYGA